MKTKKVVDYIAKISIGLAAASAAVVALGAEGVPAWLHAGAAAVLVVSNAVLAGLEASGEVKVDPAASDV